MMLEISILDNYYLSYHNKIYNCFSLGNFSTSDAVIVETRKSEISQTVNCGVASYNVRNKHTG